MILFSIFDFIFIFFPHHPETQSASDPPHLLSLLLSLSLSLSLKSPNVDSGRLGKGGALWASALFVLQIYAVPGGLFDNIDRDGVACGRLTGHGKAAAKFTQFAKAAKVNQRILGAASTFYDGP